LPPPTEQWRVSRRSGSEVTNSQHQTPGGCSTRCALPRGLSTASAGGCTSVLWSSTRMSSCHFGVEETTTERPRSTYRYILSLLLSPVPARSAAAVPPIASIGGAINGWHQRYGYGYGDWPRATGV
jgi:hypothetical protein